MGHIGAINLNIVRLLLKYSIVQTPLCVIKYQIYNIYEQFLLKN